MTTVGEVFVVIPTRNRYDSLGILLDTISDQIWKPKCVVIVDSSDDVVHCTTSIQSVKIYHLQSKTKSAAVQRNIGIDYVVNELGAKSSDLIAFLDDDVEIPCDYFESQLKELTNNEMVIGVSGVTDGVPSRKRANFINRFLGLSGPEGSITKACINMPPPISGMPRKVKWLIGCSTWKINHITEIRFEKDFEGNSIFEDVIFSFRASKNGLLVCIPSLLLRHKLDPRGRPNFRNHYRDLVKNRYRIFRYSNNEFSKTLFWLNTILTMLFFLCKAFLGSKQYMERALGVFLGMVGISKEQRKSQT